MRLLDIKGRIVNKNVAPYLIKWEAKSPSKLQYRVKQFLRKYWQNMIVYEEFPVFGTRMRVDFVNLTKRIAIEVQGSQHESFNKFFHGGRFNYKESITRDVKKIEWLESNKFRVIEIYEKEVDLLSIGFFRNNFGIELV